MIQHTQRHEMGSLTIERHIVMHTDTNDFYACLKVRNTLN